MGQQDTGIFEHSDLSLLETIDHVLNRGLVISGHVTISVADIDLVYVGLNVVLGSVETIGQVLGERPDIEREDVRVGGPQANDPAGDP